MPVPDSYPIKVEIDGVDFTDRIPFDSCSMRRFRQRVGYFRCRVESPTTDPVKGKSFIVFNANNNDIVFNGYIIRVEETKQDNGVVKNFEIEAADQFIRLQNSVIDYCESSASSEAQIISDLFGCTFPDFTDDFDFTSGVATGLPGLDFVANNQSLLDALNDLNDKVGGRNWRLRDEANGKIITTFDESSTNQPPGFDYARSENTDITLTAIDFNTSTSFTSNGVVANGNPGNCYEITDTNVPTAKVGSLTFTFSEDVSIYDFSFDIFYTDDESTSTQSTFLSYRDASGTIIDSLGSVEYTAGSWQTITFKDSVETGTDVPLDNNITTCRQFSIRLRLGNSDVAVPVSNAICRLDNISFSVGLGTDLDWGDTPYDADFDLDIDLSDEYGFDYNLEIGDYDDFNSITITGGYQSEEIDWFYNSQGSEERINLETAIDNIRVFKNSGAALVEVGVGIWGTDEFSFSIPCLHDPVDHWLYFDSNLVNSAQAVQVTGTIRKPIRVRVNDYESGDLVSARSYHNENITSEEEAVNLGIELLARQKEIKRLTFTTYNPGLLPGDEITVTDSARGLNETLTIQSISTKWIGSSGHAEFDIECGQQQEITADIIMARNSKAANDVEVPPGTTVRSIEFLVDSNGDDLVDSNGERLYVVTG